MSERFSYAGDMLGPRERFEPFVTTQWTVVLAAGDEDSSATVRDALERLCETYWYPLYAFARRKGCSPHLSEDLVQGFFAQMLRLKSLGKASRERGRFRSFLLASFQHYIADAYARSKAQKRGGDRAILSLDAVQAEEAVVDRQQVAGVVYGGHADGQRPHGLSELLRPCAGGRVAVAGAGPAHRSGGMVSMKRCWPV